MAAFWGQRFSIVSWLNLILVDMGITSDLYAVDTRLGLSFGREDKHITRRRVVYAVEVLSTLSRLCYLTFLGSSLGKVDYYPQSVGRSLTVILYRVFSCTMGMQLLLKKSFNVPPLNIAINIKYESQCVP